MTFSEQKEQKSLTNLIGRGTAWSSSGSVLIKLTELITLFFILQHLSVYEYGLVKIIFSIIAFFDILTLPGFNGVIIVEMGIAKGKGLIEDVKGIFNGFFWLKLILSLVAWVALYFGSEIIVNYYTSPIGKLLKIASFIVLLYPIRSIYHTLFSVYYRFFEKSLLSFLEVVFRLGLVLFFFFVLGMGIEGVVLAYVCGLFLSLLFILPLFIRVYKPFVGIKANGHPFIREFIRKHGKWSIFSKYLNIINQNSRIWIIKLFLGTEAVGLFSVATSFITAITSLVPISSIIAPILPQYRGAKEIFNKIVVKSIRYQLTSLMLIGAFAFFFLPVLVVNFFPQYNQSIFLFNIMILSFVPFSFSSVLTTVFYTFQEQRKLFFLTLVKFLTIIVLTPIFALAFGLPGVAITVVIDKIAPAFLRYRIAKKILSGFNIRFKEFFSIDNTDRIIFAKIKNSLYRQLIL